jgi:hypothetical protein
MCLRQSVRAGRAGSETWQGDERRRWREQPNSERLNIRRSPPSATAPGIRLLLGGDALLSGRMTRTRAFPRRAVIAASLVAIVAAVPPVPVSASDQSVTSPTDNYETYIRGSATTNPVPGTSPVLDDWSSFRTGEYLLVPNVFSRVCRYQGGINWFSPDGATVYYTSISSFTSGCTTAYGTKSHPDMNGRYVRGTIMAVKWRSNRTPNENWRGIGNMVA